MALLTKENVTYQPISEGEAGIVIKLDGSFRIFNHHKNLDPNSMTAAQRKQTETLMALCCALKFPEIMQLLVDCSTDPALVGDTLELGPTQ